MTTIRGIDAAYNAASLDLFDRAGRKGDDGIARLLLVTDRAWDRGSEGGGSWAAAEITMKGRNGAHMGTIALHSSALRHLADRANLLADFTDARAKGEAGPCLCSAWGHNLVRCPNPSRLDYSMCAECWPDPDENGVAGQSALDMGHGAGPKPWDNMEGGRAAWEAARLVHGGDLHAHDWRCHA